jgi:FkbM family methyltransferase
MREQNMKNLRHLRQSCERIVFGALNDFLSWLVAKTKGSRIIFDIFGRLLPVPEIIVRGVAIRVMIPLNEVGVFSTVKHWEEREPEVLDWLDGFEKGAIFFDIGASFGTETLYAALKKDGPAKIVAFDPSFPSSFNLAMNINLNNITKVDQYYLALADGLKLISFSEPGQYYCVKGRPKFDQITYKTLSMSLDQFVGMTGIIPDYIKIDVDGAEENLVLGMSEMVRNDRLKSVVVEVTEQSEAWITNFFAQAGFTIVYARILEKEEAGRRYFKNVIFSRRRLCDRQEKPSLPPE